MIASLSKFNSRRLSLPSETESKKRSMIKELRVDYRKCFTNSALSSTAKRFSPTTRRLHVTTDCLDGEISSILASPIRFLCSVAVGTALASGPPHGSVREGLPHTALTSGSCDDQPLVGIWMQYPCGREPVANQPRHVLPTSTTKFLTSSSQHAKPDAAHLVADPAQTKAVTRYRMIVEPPPNH